MQINPELIASIYYNLRLGFQAAYEQTPTWFERVSMVMPSSSRQNIYPWLKQVPRVREWIGERVLNNLTARGYAITNKKFEDTITVDKDDIEDDNLGAFAGAVAMMGAQAKKWPDDRMTLAIQQGVSTLCFDGQNFFNDSHPIDGDVPSLGTYSNNFVLTELNPENYSAGRAAMMSYRGEDNKPLNINPTLLVGPPQLETRMRQILQASLIAPAGGLGIGSTAQQTNILAGSAEPLVIPELSNEPTTWYLLDVTKPVKPFIWQLRRSPVLTSLTSPTDPNVFMGQKYIYGFDMRGNHGYSLPWLAARFTAAAT